MKVRQLLTNVCVLHTTTLKNHGKLFPKRQDSLM